MTHSSNRKTSLLTAAIAASLILSACGGGTAETKPAEPAKPAQSTQTESAKPAEPAKPSEAKSETKTETAKPAEQAAEPTKAPEPAKSQEPLGTVMENYKAAKSYRADMLFSIKGEIMDIPVADAADVPFMRFNGAYSGKNSQINVGGMLIVAMGADPKKGLELIESDGGVYLKGPLELVGAKEDAWYLMPLEQSGSIKPPISPGEFLKDFSGEDAKDFKPTGSETIGGQTCTVHTMDKEALLKQGDGALSKDFERLDSAEAKVVTCPDGYMHRFEVAFSGASKKDPSKTGSVSLTINMSDFDKVDPIKPPADAKPLSGPGGEGATPVEDAAQAPGATIDSPAAASGDYDTTFPLIGAVSDFNRMPSPTEDEIINYVSDAELKDIFDFYVAEFSKRGLTERKVVSTVNEQVVSIVMDGVDGGKSVIIQAVWLDKTKRNINVRVEKSP
jgi:hypothetical protein